MKIWIPKAILRVSYSDSTRFQMRSVRSSVGSNLLALRPARLLCSGKIAPELRAERARRQRERTAIVVLEQIYPFPAREMREELEPHPGAEEIVCVQEEPANMGALFFVRPLLQRLASDRFVTAVRRLECASPATVSAKAHALLEGLRAQHPPGHPFSLFVQLERPRVAGDSASIGCKRSGIART